MVKIWDEPRKITPTSERENFCRLKNFGGLAPVVSVIRLFDRKSQFLNKKMDFWCQISKFWGQNSIFSSLAANWSLTNQFFSTKKVSHWFPDMRVPKVILPSPQKIGFLAQKRPNLAQNWHFRPNIGIFGPFDLLPDQKTKRTSCLGGFLLCWYQNFYLLP